MILKTPFQIVGLVLVFLNLLQKRVQAVCPDACQKCVDGDDTKCEICKTNFFLNQQTCLAKCPDGSYGDVATKLCKPCPANCNKCAYYDSKVNCLQCTNILNPATMTCVDKCTEFVEYVNDTISDNKTCASCSISKVANCGKCNQTNCLKCGVGFYNESSGMNEDMKIERCISCNIVGGSASCNNCSLDNQVIHCYSCIVGFTLEKNQTCVPCTSNCSECDRNRCKKCKTGFYPLYPDYKNCDKCSRPDQELQPSPEYENTNVCVYKPKPVQEMGKIRFDVYRAVQAAIFQDVCDDNGNIMNNNYNVYYACSIKEDVINAAKSKQDILAKIPAGENVTFPDYKDLESKFYGKSTNNTMLCPGKNNGIYFIKYFCENKFGMISPASRNIVYRIPLSEGRQTQLLLLFDRNLTELQRERLICKLEDKSVFDLQGKYLVRTPKGQVCTNTSMANTSNTKRSLATFTGYENAYPVLVDHDPYSVIEADVSEGVMDVMYSHFNRTINNFFKGELVYLGFEVNQMPYSLVTEPIKPEFKYRTRSKIAVVNATQFVVKLVVTNVDSVVYVGFNTNYSFRTRPNNVEELKWSKDIRTMYSYISRKGKEKTLTFTGLEPNTNYTFYFGAEEYTSGLSNYLYYTHLITTSFGPVLQTVTTGLMLVLAFSYIYVF